MYWNTKNPWASHSWPKVFSKPASACAAAVATALSSPYRLQPLRTLTYPLKIIRQKVWGYGGYHTISRPALCPYTTIELYVAKFISKFEGSSFVITFWVSTIPRHSFCTSVKQFFHGGKLFWYTLVLSACAGPYLGGPAYSFLPPFSGTKVLPLPCGFPLWRENL